MQRVAVVIPFYQREESPLVRAIQSILKQDDTIETTVLIVDDGSPCSAADILARHFPDQTNLRLLTQPNAGASSARNTGLDHIPEDTDWVAFLDSDDEWAPDHLSRALTALSTGHDLYFADHLRPDWPNSKFTSLEIDYSRHHALSEGAGLYSYSGDPLLAILQDHLIQTSTVVLRSDIAKDMRFRTNLVLGEDELYWVHAIRRARGIAFSSGLGVHMGKGVNISQNTEQSCEKALKLTRQSYLFWKCFPEYLPDELAALPLREQRMTALRRDFAVTFLHCFHGDKEFRAVLREGMSFTTLDPTWVTQVLQLVACRLLGTSS